MSKNVTEQTFEDDSGSVTPSAEVQVRRAAERATYDAETVHAIVDAGMVAHVGTIRDGLPVVIPMFCVRDEDHLLMHGAPATGTLRRSGAASAESVPVCVTMTLLDGLVLARSSFHHSMNYRSVVIIGEAEVITDSAEKERALDMFVEQLMSGRQAELRPTTRKEVQGTSVMRVSLANASAKVRTGPPVDDEEDYGTSVWAGVVPITSSLGAPEADPRLSAGISVPAKIAALQGREL